VWQNGDASLALAAQGVADGSRSGLWADLGLEAINASLGGVGGDDQLLETLEVGAKARYEGVPLIVGILGAAEGA
jgi:hypothetical protein